LKEEEKEEEGPESRMSFMEEITEYAGS
jgi:hypothetical protein